MSTVELNAIVAMNNRGVIGRNNLLPWYIPEDLQYFKSITQNQIVVMGRKTYDSLPTGPLPNRINVVLTTRPEKYKQLEKMFVDQLYFVNAENLNNLLETLREKYSQKRFIVMGGSQLYERYYPSYNKIYLTIVDDDYVEAADVYSVFTPETITANYVETSRESVKRSRVNNQKYQHVIFEKKETS